MLCLTNTSFVQWYSLGSRNVCCTLVFNFVLFSNFCFAFFASQTSGLCSAFPSAPAIKSVTRFCYALVRTLFSAFCLKNTGFVQCYSLGSRQVCCMPVFILLRSVIFCFACFAPPSPPPPTSGLCSAFPFASPQVYTLLVFFVLFSLLLLCVLCPTSSGLCSDFSPAPLEFARFIFRFVLFSFKFVFCVLSLTNLIWLQWCYFLGPCRFWMIMFSFAFFCNLTRVSPRGLQFCGSTPLSQCIYSLVFLVVFLFF